MRPPILRNASCCCCYIVKYSLFLMSTAINIEQTLWCFYMEKSQIWPTFYDMVAFWRLESYSTLGLHIWHTEPLYSIVGFLILLVRSTCSQWTFAFTLNNMHLNLHHVLRPAHLLFVNSAPYQHGISILCSRFWLWRSSSIIFKLGYTNKKTTSTLNQPIYLIALTK